jgi:pilus assembly protein Flp/PilA
MHVLHAMRGLAKDDCAATLVEYGLLLALIALVSIFAISTLGTQVSSEYTNAGNEL